MECLIDWVGLLGCQNDDPISGIFINSLPGMPLESVDKIANAEQATYLGVWGDVQLRTSKKFERDVIAQFRKRYRCKRIAESIDLLKVIDTTDNQTPQSGQWRGFKIDLVFKNTSKIVASAFQAINIQTLSIYLKAAIANPITIKIFDLQTGDVLDSFSLTDSVQGWNLIQVNKRYFVYHLFIGYDATLVESVYQDVTNDFMYSNSSWFDQIYGIGSCNMVIKPSSSLILSSTVKDDDLTTSHNLMGLTGVFALQCRYDPLVCNNKDNFTIPWMYLLGIEIMNERIFTNRINRYTTVGRDQAKELRDHYQAEYDKYLSIACDDIDLNLDDSCLECYEMITVREAVL